MALDEPNQAPQAIEPLREKQNKWCNILPPTTW
jgi:hypothetical protein